MSAPVPKRTKTSLLGGEDTMIKKALWIPGFVTISIAVAATLGGCAAAPEEDTAAAEHGLATDPAPAVCEAEPWPGLTDDDAPTTEGEDAEPHDDPYADFDAAGGFAPQTLGPATFAGSCEQSCDAAFPPVESPFGPCWGLFHTACYVACRGTDSAKAACAQLRGGRAPRGWVKALQRICAIAGL